MTTTDPRARLDEIKRVSRYFELNEYADGTLVQTNGNGFSEWLASHDRAVEVDALREAAQGQPTHIRNHLLLLALQMEDDTE